MNLPAKLGSRRLVDTLAVAAAVLASIGMVRLTTDSALVTAVFTGGLVTLGLVAFSVARNRPAPSQPLDALPADWSVTLAAIDQPNIAIAITDRANRLVCANGAFDEWFGAANAPPHLSVEAESAEILVRAARTAWREGECDTQTIAQGERRWALDIKRAGRSEDHLVWRLAPVMRAEPLMGIGKYVTGVFGQMLSEAGIELALVAADGTIRAVNSGFARRACGDANASMAGQEFVSLLRTDDRDHIYFAREGRDGSPHTLVHVPLSDPEAGAAADPQVPSLMLLIDETVGLGGWGSDARGQTPQLEALLEKLPLGLAMTDRDGHFLFANPAFMRGAGLEDRALPPYPSDLVIRQDKTAISDAVRRFGQGAAATGDIAVRLRSQPEEPISLGLAGVRGLGEAAVLLSLVDSTEETRLKRQVAQATKMQAVGQLAGGVAHDFNNVLTAIIGYCDLMLLRHTPGDSDYDDIQQIKANSNRAASLTRQLLAFSRQQTLQPEVLQLPDIISEVNQLLKRLLGAKITLKTHHDRELGAVRADPRQLEQVIVNLAVNARDAIQGEQGEQAHGTLTFSTRRVSAREIRDLQSDIIPAGEYTLLVAEDTGGGIPPDDLGKIFEPFFTTKEQGKGTGLGLATVYGIVKQSGGFIFADNVELPDGTIQGARFTIYLPVHQASEEDEGKAEDEEPGGDWSGGGRILLVEDEDMVRAVAERALTRQGYSVVTANDGDEGVAAVRDGEEFDLVVSDVVMPSMDGPAMAREIRQLHPRLPVLFMSGYAEEQLRREIDIEGMHFIAKPFSVQQIADKVAQVLVKQRR